MKILSLWAYDMIKTQCLKDIPLVKRLILVLLPSPIIDLKVYEVGHNWHYD